MNTLWNYIRFLEIDFLDVLEITVVAFLIYRILVLWAGTRAFQMLFGLFLLIAIYTIANALQLVLISSILSQAFLYAAFALIVVFQPELRSALARLGRNPLLNVVTRMEQKSQVAADEISRACADLARTRTGAIIAVEQEVSLEEYIENTGSRLRSDISADLLVSIFATSSPLHDGALVIRGNEIVAAGVHLPLTQYPLSDKSLGTRHRATVGLSEETDAYVIVVSEETGQISVARRGVLRRGIEPSTLRERLAAASTMGGSKTHSGGELTGELVQRA